MFAYNYERMLELLKIERECVQRNHDGRCNRDCANCELVQIDTELLDMYDKAIRLVEREVKKVKREKGYKEGKKRREEWWRNLEKNDPKEYWRRFQEEAAMGEGY